MRLSEGAALAGFWANRSTASRTDPRVEADPSRSAEAIRARLAEQVASLMDTGAGLDRDRLHMEAALLATKADLREEIDRLKAHVEAARALISGEGGRPPAGFSRPGIQPRNQYHMFEVQCGVGDCDRA
jgi:uncharacterized protein YicC (UPF0701 family)